MEGPAKSWYCIGKTAGTFSSRFRPINYNKNIVFEANRRRACAVMVYREGNASPRAAFSGECASMTKDEFVVQIMDMKKTLYHIACGILRSEADREDAVQECICKAWEKQDSLKSDAAFKAWVTRILINECYDICRRNGKVIVLDELPERAAPETEDNRELRDLIYEMDEIYRMPILLFYVEGFSIKEISRILRIPEGTVKSRLFAGRAKLRSVLGEEVPV